MHKLVLLRHGESIWNRDNIFTGWVDVELSERGKEQAEEAARILKEQGFVFDIAFASVLKRAVKTLEIVLETMGLSGIPFEKAWQLNERHYGSLQGVGKKDAVKRFGLEQVMAWRRGYKQRPPESSGKEPPFSESLEDVFLRVSVYWREKIVPTIQQGKTVLISAHGNSLRALVKWLDKISDQEIEKLNIPIGIPLVYELDDNLKPLKHYYLAKPEQLEKAVKAVEEETKVQ